MATKTVSVYIPERMQEIIKTHIPAGMSMSKFMQALMIREILEPSNNLERFSEGVSLFDMASMTEENFKTFMGAAKAEIPRPIPPMQEAVQEQRTELVATAKHDLPAQPTPRPSRRSGAGTGANQLGF